MKNQLISEITRQMLPHLDNAQMEHLQEVLRHTLWCVQVIAGEEGILPPDKETNAELLDMFLSAKRVSKKGKDLKNPLFCGIIEEEKSFRIYNSVTFRGGIFCCGSITEKCCCGF